MTIKKFYELQTGDVAVHDGSHDTFIKLDGGYAQWTKENGELGIGHYADYELKEDGLHYPLIYN